VSLRAPTSRGVAISLIKFQIPKSNLQTNPNIEILNALSIGALSFDIVLDLVLVI
jgi:hypothetical protein